jgi:general stress protein 26
VTRAELLQFMRGHRYAVQASVSSRQTAQAAVVGIAVTDDFEIVFDTVATTRKAQNLRHNPAIAFVIGGTAGDERTVQYDGIADEPSGPDLERLAEVYYAQFPDGRQRLSWPGLVYFRARARWIRYTDFSRDPPDVLELDFR